MRMQKNSGRKWRDGSAGDDVNPRSAGAGFSVCEISPGGGQLARLTLDRPEHNLLNERMLAEVAAGINSLSRRSEVKLIVMDSAGKRSAAVSLGYTQRRVFQCWLLQRIFGDAGHVEAGAGGDQRAGVWRKRGLAALEILVITTRTVRSRKLNWACSLRWLRRSCHPGAEAGIEQVLTGEVMTERARKWGVVNWLVSEGCEKGG